MRLLPPQWAALVVIVVDVAAIVFGLLTGEALLPRSANVVLTVISVVLMLGTRLWSRGGFGYDSFGSLWALLRKRLPVWLIVAVAIAFWGGLALFAVPLLTQDTAALDAAANQRGWAGLSLAFASGTFLYAGIVARAAESR